MTGPRVEAACAAYKGVAGRVSRQAMVPALEAADEVGRGGRPSQDAIEAAREAAHNAYHRHNETCGCRTVAHLSHSIADAVLAATGGAARGERFSQGAIEAVRRFAPPLYRYGEDSPASRAIEAGAKALLADGRFHFYNSKASRDGIAEAVLAAADEAVPQVPAEVADKLREEVDGLKRAILDMAPDQTSTLIPVATLSKITARAEKAEGVADRLAEALEEYRRWAASMGGLPPHKAHSALADYRAAKGER